MSASPFCHKYLHMPHPFYLKRNSMKFNSCDWTHPDEQLSNDHVGHRAGEVQSCASVSVPVGLVNLLLGAVCQQQHHQPQVIFHHGAEQLLPQGHIRLGEAHQEQLLLVLGSDPAFFLLPGGKEVTGTARVRQGGVDVATVSREIGNLKCRNFGHREPVLWWQLLTEEAKGWEWSANTQGKDYCNWPERLANVKWHFQTDLSTGEGSGLRYHSGK